MQVCRNQNGCQLVTSFFDDPHKLLFLADYVILSKIISILGIRLSEYRKFYVPAVLHPSYIYNDMLSEHFPINFYFSCEIILLFKKIVSLSYKSCS